MPTDSRVPYVVLVGLDPLVGLAEIAERAGKSRPAVANWRARDHRFPAPIAELKSGPVFALSAVDDYLAIRDSHPTPATAEHLRQLDAQARAARDHTDWSDPTAADLEILWHNQVGMHLAPYWQWNSDLGGPIGGGTWMLGHFTADDDSDTGEAVEPVAKVSLRELMARRDWEMWLHLHVQYLDQVIHTALALMDPSYPGNANSGSSPPAATADHDRQDHNNRETVGGRKQKASRPDDHSVQLAAGTLTLTAMLEDLADAVVEHGEELQQRPELLAPIAARFALGLVTARSTRAASKDLLDDIRNGAYDDVEIPGTPPRPVPVPDTPTQAAHPASPQASVGNRRSTSTVPYHLDDLVEEPEAADDLDDPFARQPLFALATAPSRAAVQAYERLVGLSQRPDSGEPVFIAISLALQQLLAHLTDYHEDDLQEIWWGQQSETTDGVRLITSAAFTIVGARRTWQLHTGITTDHSARDWARPLIADLVHHVAVEYDVESWSADAYRERARRIGQITTVGGLLIARRRQLRLTQQGLAVASGVHVNSIRHWELGDTRPGRRSVPGLAKGLRLPEPVLVDTLAGIRHQDVWPLPDVDPNQRLV